MTEQLKVSWVDRALLKVAPRWQIGRMRARIAAGLMMRHYEGAAAGRRTAGWKKGSGDVNAAIGPALGRLREQARDLVRNNPYAKSALRAIADKTCGWGIVGKPAKANAPADTAWRAWADTTACDADGQHDFYGLQKLVIKTVAESGECLVRRRFRRMEQARDGTAVVEGGLPMPMQIQILDPDFLDTSRDMKIPGTLNRIVQGVEFDAIGRRVAYWLFPEHPGSMLGSFQASVRVSAENILHVFDAERGGQVRGPSWFAPVLLRMKDLDEFEDATLMKQKIAACLAVLMTSDGSDALGEAGPGVGTQEIDYLDPGMIKTVAPGQDIKIVDPPQTREYDGYTKTNLRACATGLGVTYEDMTGDYADMPFSAARMSRLSQEDRIHDWRWRLLIPQFCDPVWAWAMQSAAIMDQRVQPDVKAKWTPPPLPMVNPEAEGLAEQRMIRIGGKSWAEMARERGYDPDDLLKEIAAYNKKFDELGIVFDCDARRMTQAGQLQTAPATAPEPPAVDMEADDAERSRRLWRAVSGQGRR